MILGIAMGLACGLLFGSSTVQGEETLQGTWKLTAGESNGKTLSQQQLEVGKLVIDGDRYRVTLDGVGTITGVQKLAATSTTKTIEITDATGPHKDQTCFGIYEVEGDEFRVAFAPPGKPAPTNFTTAADNGYWVHVWTRVKE